MIGVAGKLKLDADGDVWFQCEDGNFKVAWPDEGCNIFRQLQEVFEHHAKNAVFKAAPKSKASGLFGEIPPMDEGKPLPKCLKCGISITLRPHGVLCPPCAQKDVKIYREGAEKSIEEYERSVEEYERRKAQKSPTPKEWVEAPRVQKCIKCGKPLTQHQIDQYSRWCDACEDRRVEAAESKRVEAAGGFSCAKCGKPIEGAPYRERKVAGRPVPVCPACADWGPAKEYDRGLMCHDCRKPILSAPFSGAPFWRDRSGRVVPICPSCEMLDRERLGKPKKSEAGPTCHDCHKSITELPYEREDFETREKIRLCKECATEWDDVFFDSPAKRKCKKKSKKCKKCGDPSVYGVSSVCPKCLQDESERTVDAVEAIGEAKRKKARKKKAGKPTKKKAKKVAKRKKSKKKGGKKR